jgi:hypothetical protein
MMSYIRFCSSIDIEPRVPISDANMCLWAAYSVTKSTTSNKRPLTYHSVKNYVYGISSIHAELGFEDWADTLTLLPRCLKGIKRELGVKSQIKRLPITTELLSQMLAIIDPASNYSHALFWAAATMGTYGLLRMSEFCASDSKSQDEFKLVSLQQVQLYASTGTEIPLHDDSNFERASYYTLQLRTSKTDPFRRGVKLFISGAPAVSALLIYLSFHSQEYRHNPNNYLFIERQNSANAILKRSSMINMTRAVISSLGLHGDDYHGHSFRRGGATSLSMKQVPDHLIQVLGRWASQCFKLYIDIPISKLIQTNSIM